MKRLLVMGLCLGLLAGCAQVYDGPTEEKRVLVRQEWTSYHRFEGFAELEPITHLVEYGYDQEGNRAFLRQNFNGKDQWIRRSSYDEAGREIREAVSDYHWGIPILRQVEETTFDAAGRVQTKTTSSLKFWENSTTYYIYEGNIEIQTDGDGNEIHWCETRTDEAGRVAELVYRDFSYRYTYDAAGNTIRMERLQDGEITYVEDMTYDDQNRILSRSYLSGGERKTIRWTYDDARHTITCHRQDGSNHVEYYNGYGEMYYRADYDDEGNLSAEEYRTYDTILIRAKEDAS